VQVKARQNDEVNKEWLCDEGRYGFGRFLPQERVTTPIEKGKPVEWENIWQAFRKIKDAEPVVFLGPDITVEDYYVIKQYLDRSVKKYQLSVAYKERSLTDVEAILISPDYAANYKGAEFLGLVSDAGKSYQEALSKIRSGEVKSLLVIGDKAFDNRDLDVATLAAIARVPDSIGLLSDAAGSLTAALSVVAPIKTILEVSGCLINRKLRIQYSDRVINPSDSTKAIWEVINHAASLSSVNILNNITNDRELTNFVLGSESKFSGLTIKNIKAGGVDLQNWQNKKDGVSATLTA
jgi:NADH-quinone oxidoreductase subunit G